ncbi:MAG TPA: HEPN domain-containing protein [Planctomycetota bacterium]|nr:HEPN domain-containing protein [Planctomycetota bacterium]
MVDTAKQIAYWRDGAEEALGAARDLAEKHRWGFCLFLAHLALEKLLKAHVCKQMQDLAPRTHNLLYLARLADLSLTPEQENTLADMNGFCREGRYPDEEARPLSAATAGRHLPRVEELHEWLLQTL